MRDSEQICTSWLESWAGTQPDAEAILSFDRAPLSYAGLQELIAQTSDSLHAAGIERSDRVALVLPNGPSTATACLAVSASATCVPLNPDYTEAELIALFELLRIDVLITSSRTKEAARNAAKLLICPTLDLEIPNGAASGVFSLQSSGDWERRPTTRSSDHRADDSKRGHAKDRCALDEIAFVLHTSGSTSRPKVVPLTHRSLLASAKNVADSLALGPEDRCLHMLPLYHVGALVDLLLAPLSRGGAVLCADKISSTLFFEALDRFECTWVQGVPTMLQDVHDRAQVLHRAGQANSLRLIRSVSAPLPTPLLAKVEATLAAPVIEIYGMTETSGLICSNSLNAEERRAGSVGHPAGPEVKVVDENGDLLGPEQSGEVLVRGETVMQGYEGGDTGDGLTFEEGWFRTGDQGHFDSQGRLSLTGRLKELINRGGEKIAPAEIDAVAMSHPGVLEAAAFALPHPSLGEEVALAIVRRRDEQIEESDLLRLLSERLAYYKVPRSIYWLDALPRGGSGKLQRHRLVESIKAERTSLERPDWIEPEGELAQGVAELWQRVLSVSKIGLADDFFDLGGDSLKATTLIAELEATRGVSIEISTLFDAPTLGAFVDAFPQTDSPEQGGARISEMDTPPGIPPEIYRPLADYLSTWQGRRPHEKSLLIGRNTHGSRPPLFWGMQASVEFDALADHLDADQPIYAFRSLYKTKLRGVEPNRQLANYYAREIRNVCPTGPYWLGGFCEAGKIAFEIAQQLAAVGEEIALLALQEQFVPAPYEGRVAFFFCEPGKHSPYRYYINPERGWSKFYTGPTALYRSAHTHDDYYDEIGIAHFAAQLHAAMDDARNGRLSSPLVLETGLQRLPSEAYRAAIQVRPPRLLARGERRVLNVAIENRSPTVWASTRESGILLGSRWRNRRGKHKVWIDGRTRLESAVAPGERVELDLEVAAPNRGWLWTLDIDLVDEGIGWFGEFGSQPALNRVLLKK